MVKETHWGHSYYWELLMPNRNHPSTSWWKPEKQRADKIQFLWLISNALTTMQKKMHFPSTSVTKAKFIIDWNRLWWVFNLYNLGCNFLVCSMQQLELDQKYSKMKKTEGVNLSLVLFSAPSKKFLCLHAKMDRDINIHICIYTDLETGMYLTALVIHPLKYSLNCHIQTDDRKPSKNKLGPIFFLKRHIISVMLLFWEKCHR